jgi:hypothetical protein
MSKIIEINNFLDSLLIPRLLWSKDFLIIYIYIYKTECLFVCIFCMQIYSFTPILMKFCTLDLQNKKKITVYFNFIKTNPYYPTTLLRKKDSVFELEIPSPSPLHPYFILWVYRHLRRLTPTKSNPYYHF